MKVATKVAAGAALLVGLLVVGQVRDMALVRKMATLHRTLSQDRFAAVTSTLDILRKTELIEARLQKLFITRDVAYADQLDRMDETVDRDLALQQVLDLPRGERAALTDLSARWGAYRTAYAKERAQLTDAHIQHSDPVRGRLVDQISDVEVRAVTLLSALQAGIDRDVARARRQAVLGERLSWGLAALAVFSALLFVIVVLRSLNAPLARLIAATRSVGAGRFARLAPKGRDELSELARAFDAMVERLDELDQMKREFLSRVSHELKTPLSAMQETNQLLLEELAGPLTDKQRRLLQLTLDAGKRLSAMLTRLLDLSRLEAGAVSYDVRRVAVGELLSTAYHEFEARMRDKQITATLTVPPSPLLIDADRDWLVQVFENLLENAVKFSPPQRRIWIELRLARPEEPLAGLPERARALLARGPCAWVTIADEGPGVPPAMTERIFERFFQVERRPRAGGGVGLGLAICQDIVAAHGGTLWAANRVEGGSEFSVALPLSTEQKAERDPPPAHPHPESDGQPRAALAAPPAIERV